MVQAHRRLPSNDGRIQALVVNRVNPRHMGVDTGTVSEGIPPGDGRGGWHLESGVSADEGIQPGQQLQVPIITFTEITPEPAGRPLIQPVAATAASALPSSLMAGTPTGYPYPGWCLVSEIR